MNCYLCKHDDFDLIVEKLRYESPSGGKAYKCKNCGLYFLSPQMTPEQERVFYEKEYGEIFSEEKGTTPADLFESRQGDAELYDNWSSAYLKDEHDCLEIGCASGYFLDRIKEKVKSVSGIETHEVLRDYCKKIGIQMYSSLDECQDEQFDSIFMFFLLEHLGDPIGYLKSLKRVLKKNGGIYIIVPNADDILLSTYEINGFREFYFTPAHQFYYSPKALSTIFEEAGYKTYNFDLYQRYDLSNHMHWMMNGKPGGLGKYAELFGEELDNAYKNRLVEKGLCDTIYAIVKKTE